MPDRLKPVLTWVLRLAGVALLAWLLATQLQWQDAIVLSDGTVREGAVRMAPDGGYVLAAAHGEAGGESIAREAVATRAYGDGGVPDVTYGVRTLLRRLHASWPTVALVLGVLALLVVLTGLRWMLLTRAVQIPMPPGRAVRLTFVGGFFNIAVPGATGGDVVKAWYARKEAKARFPDRAGVGMQAVLSVFVDRFVGLFGLVVFAAAVLLVTARGPAFDVPRAVVLTIFSLGVVGGVVILVRPVRRALGLAWLMQRLPFQGLLREIRAAATLYRGHLPALAASMVISLFNHAGNATCCWLLARALGIEGVTLGTALALVPIANLLSAIPLLPGGWGVGELAFAYFFGLVGVPPTEAIGLSVMFRLGVLGVNLPGGLLWILWKDHASADTIAAEMTSVTARAANTLPAEPPAEPSQETA
ncbi:MAG: lysylphosphatidylglycerol synthase transmembrane domain-containing protein [Planctomycetota bacterium]|nr:lysylphosphatidylglycerol synthase transmembrane domain-containing protein [Planctomycetota bacterium]